MCCISRGESCIRPFFFKANYGVKFEKNQDLIHFLILRTVSSFQRLITYLNYDTCFKSLMRGSYVDILKDWQLNTGRNGGQTWQSEA